MQRFMDGEWVGVECHRVDFVEKQLYPGERKVWHWTVESDQTMGACGELPDVEAGLCRGVVGLITPPDYRGDELLFTEFDVV